MKQRKINIDFEEYNFEELNTADKNLLSKAAESLKTSYSPYSHFRVGAAILLEDEIIVKASNQENAAYPSGLCAERVAIFYASANYPDKKIKSIAVVADTDESELLEPVTPCGACRQVFNEYEIKQNQSFSILLKGKSNLVYKLNKTSDLLPLSFDGQHLKK
jgi:cytidine deaminase